ncbi:MAG: SRPBCC domain-containing protein [Chloroflexota bacterium]
MATPTKNTAKVTVSKNIHVPASQLYSALTTRDHLNNWFCDNCFLQVQEGGRYVFIWNAENYSASGMFTELVQDEKLVLTWRSTYEGEESELQETFAVTLVADGDDATTVTIEHSDIAEDGVEAYQYQWDMRLEHLKTYAETGALPRIVNRVILGIMPQPVSAERAEELGIEAGTQAQVGQVIAGLGAEKAGIEADDVITHIDGQAISIANNLMQPVRDKTPGDVVDVTVVRGDETLSLEMSLSAYPVPEMPTDYTALAEQIAPQYDTLMTDIHALIDSVSDDITSQRPADGEWSVQMVLAHLLYSEDYLQDQIGGR